MKIGSYAAIELEGLEVGRIVGLVLDGLGVEAGEEGLGEGDFGRHDGKWSC